MPQNEYTVIIGGERFVLNRNQLQLEPDSYLATHFLTGNGNKELKLYSDPLLFRLIHLYFQGYRVFPIPEQYIPYMTIANVLENLYRDVAFLKVAGMKQPILMELDKRGLMLESVAPQLPKVPHRWE